MIGLAGMSHSLPAISNQLSAVSFQPSAISFQRSVGRTLALPWSAIVSRYAHGCYVLGELIADRRKLIADSQYMHAPSELRVGRRLCPDLPRPAPLTSYMPSLRGRADKTAGFGYTCIGFRPVSLT